VIGATCTPFPHFKEVLLQKPTEGEAMQILGIDIGGSGVKGALVDVQTGKLTTERFKVPTPRPATPRAVTTAVVEVAMHFRWAGKIGCGFPGLVIDGLARTAPNLDGEWAALNIQETLSSATACDTIVLNDADVAGVAEMTFGAGRNQPGTVLVLTLGTGIGSVMFRDGVLSPNFELGHLILNNGMEAEHFASAEVRERQELSWKRWASRLSKVLQTYESLFSPDLFIIGGGVSRKADKFFPELKTKYARFVVAEMQNNAGIVGAAMAVAQKDGDVPM
jgi:polyphosphate glucokinase